MISCNSSSEQMYFISLGTQTEKTCTVFRLFKKYFHVGVFTVNNKSREAMVVFQLDTMQLVLCLLFIYRLTEALLKPQAAP